MGLAFQSVRFDIAANWWRSESPRNRNRDSRHLRWGPKLFMCCLVLSKKTHRQNSQEISGKCWENPGQSREMFVCVFSSMFIRFWRLYAEVPRATFRRLFLQRWQKIAKIWRPNICRLSPFDVQEKWPQNISRKIRHRFQTEFFHRETLGVAGPNADPKQQVTEICNHFRQTSLLDLLDFLQWTYYDFAQACLCQIWLGNPQI